MCRSGIVLCSLISSYDNKFYEKKKLYERAFSLCDIDICASIKDLSDENFVAQVLDSVLQRNSNFDVTFVYRTGDLLGLKLSVILGRIAEFMTRCGRFEDCFSICKVFVYN